VYVMLLLAVLVTIGPSAFNKFGLVWFGLRPIDRSIHQSINQTTN